ncbi:MAG: glycerate kinase [Actinobacteria bacterium]|nr:glycerate kinase [Actinomycetota bacterium]
MSPGLRVLVASDAIGQLDSQAAGVALARGWAEQAQVAVVPLAEGGPALGGALAAVLGGQPVVTGTGWWLRAGDTLAVGPAASDNGAEWDPEATSLDLGAWLDDCLDAGPVPGRLILDLTAVTALDGGAGLLAALGATASGELTNGLAGLGAVGSIALDRVRSRLAGTEVIGVVRGEEIGFSLLGLQGALVRRGYAAGIDPTELLVAEAAAGEWLARLGVPDGPGVGAAGGAAAVVRALGGRVVRGAALGAELAGLERTLALADVVLTGCTSFHIGNYGGPVVRFVADLAVDAQRPCLVFAGESSLSRREMRTFGVEAAYEAGVDAPPEALTATAARVAWGWTALSDRGVD